MGLSDTINSLMGDLGKFASEHWPTYLLIVLAVVTGGVLSVIFSWLFAIIIPLFILWVGFIARQGYQKQLKK